MGCNLIQKFEPEKSDFFVEKNEKSFFVHPAETQPDLDE
jgi:hypothetical protein